MSVELQIKLKEILENSLLSTVSKPIVAPLSFLKKAADRVGTAPQKETPGLSRMDKLNPLNDIKDSHTKATGGKENLNDHVINRSQNQFKLGGNDLSPEEKFKMDRTLSVNKIG